MRKRELVVSLPCSRRFWTPFLIRRDPPAFSRGETIKRWTATDRTLFVGDELEIQLGGCRVEIDAQIRRVTRFLWELCRCHTQALARAGWGRPPKGKEVWETGKLSHRRSAMCAFKLPTAVYSPKLIWVSFPFLKASYIGKGLPNLFVVGFHEPAE